MSEVNINTTETGDPIIKKVKIGEQEVPVALSQFGQGTFAGVKYLRPVFESTAQAVAAYGEDVIVDIINSEIKSRIATRVKNNLYGDDKNEANVKAAAAQTVEGIVGLAFATEDVVNYRPGERTSKKEEIEKLWNIVQEKLMSGSLSGEEARNLLTRLGSLRAKGRKS